MNKVDELLKNMTTAEKASLCSGKDFWNLKAVEELGIPSIMLTDGPHGLRKQISSADHVGLGDSLPATCFPTAAALASSWDPNLLYEIGAALGEECRQEKVAVLLGPGANIKRSPLCGRNFEYFSEDPLLSGKLAAAYIRGVQSLGIAASLKHFAANNQERRRMTIDAVVDERALREIYLAGFEEAVRDGRPGTVMCAYNRLNGEFCSESSMLLREVLKAEWGHEGIVVTDWGAANDRIKGLEAGLELEMPSSGDRNDRLIAEAVDSGRLDESVLDDAVRRILQLVFKTSEVLKDNYTYDKDAHHALARRAAAESAVLLKNKGILPLSAGRKIAVIGRFAVQPRYQGSGSSLINPLRLDSALDALKLAAGESAIVYADGYRLDSDKPERRLIAEAVAAAKDAEVAVIFAGLPDVAESEGFDREHLDMPDAHNELIKAVAAVNPAAVVVLSNGGPVTMPWINEVGAVLETYLGGQAWGSAAADLLYGYVNPCGKLAETFPLSLADVPSTVNFPGGTSSVVYAESIYIGYRYFDTVEAGVLFPFGHGLSYTEFEYSDLNLSRIDDRGSLLVSFTVKNTGGRAGCEISQIYVSDPESSVFRPEKELKGFVKTMLEAGESRRVESRLSRRAFAFWDTGQGDWCVESGRFTISLGASSRDIRLEASVDITSSDRPSEYAMAMKTLVPGYYSPDLNFFADHRPGCEFERLIGRQLPPGDRNENTGFDRTSTLEDVRSTLIGRILGMAVSLKLKNQFCRNEDEKTVAMMESLVREMPLRNTAMMSGGVLSMNRLDGLIEMMNGKFFSGLRKILAG